VPRDGGANARACSPHSVTRTGSASVHFFRLYAGMLRWGCSRRWAWGWKLVYDSIGWDWELCMDTLLTPDVWALVPPNREVCDQRFL
jgi:hypothetical protein